MRATYLYQVGMLKNSTSDLTKWHSYSAILAAVAPSSASPPDVRGVLNRLQLGSRKGLEAAMNRREQIEMGNDEPWYKEEKEKLSSSFVVKHREHVTTITDFWLSNTNVSTG